jgi:hypothetical protein
MDPSYKARKEAFVSNLSGSDIWDINAVSFVAPVSSHCFPHNLTAIDNGFF